MQVYMFQLQGEWKADSSLTVKAQTVNTATVFLGLSIESATDTVGGRTRPYRVLNSQLIYTEGQTESHTE